MRIVPAAARQVRSARQIDHGYTSEVPAIPQISATGEFSIRIAGPGCYSSTDAASGIGRISGTGLVSDSPMALRNRCSTS